MYLRIKAPLACASAIVTIVLSDGRASAQEAKPQSTPLPPVVVEQSAAPAKKTKKQSAGKKPGAASAQTAGTPSASASTGSQQGLGVNARSGSLTVPDTAEAASALSKVPGGVELVPDSQFKNSPASTIKDVLGWVPGVIVEPRWGPDGRLSIRGSGLTRNYGNRGINAFMDGIPINTSDGLFDLFEVDPTAYRYVEVYKGANALRFGANSLGGAINFVTPTGYDSDAFGARVDVGSFGYLKTAVSSGGVSGPVDYFINMSAQREDGYRDHSDNNMERLSANLGYRLSQDAETRFYVNANTWRGRLPGEVTKQAALETPRDANPMWVLQDQQRNIDSLRVANKTTLRVDDSTLVELGVFGVDRHVMHPIYRWLDYKVRDYGAFARATDERIIDGFRNRFIAGVNVLNGTMDYNEFQNLPGAVKGPMTASTVDSSENYSAYAEESFYVLPSVALIAGTQFSHVVRARRDRFFDDTSVSIYDTNLDDSGRRTFDLWSPKVGALWDVDRHWQVFANISRSGEAPTFDTVSYSTPPDPNLNAQTATTYEIGTRGSTPDFNWDVSLYRSELRNEFQCLTTYQPGTCGIVNADRTVHQGIEAGMGIAFLKSVFEREDRFWLNLVYTYNNFFFDGDAKWGNNQLPGVPPHYLRAEVLYKRGDGFYAGPNVEWMPQSFYADNANTLTVDPYALLNFKVGYDKDKGWSGYLEGRNLLDKHYISTTMTAETATASSELFNPGLGRAIYSGVQYKW